MNVCKPKLKFIRQIRKFLLVICLLKIGYRVKSFGNIGNMLDQIVLLKIPRSLLIFYKSTAGMKRIVTLKKGFWYTNGFVLQASMGVTNTPLQDIL